MFCLILRKCNTIAELVAHNQLVLQAIIILKMTFMQIGHIRGEVKPGETRLGA